MNKLYLRQCPSQCLYSSYTIMRLSVETIWSHVLQEDLTSGIYGFLLAYMNSAFALLHVFRATFRDISILA